MKKRERANCKPGQTMDAEEMVKLLLDDFHMDLNDPRLTLGSKWKDLVGEKCASHTIPSDIRGDVLFVKADHPVWVQLLQFQQHQIISRVNEAYPSLRLKRMHVLRSE